MSEKYIHLAGRTASGKTEMILAYANQYPKTTLILSKEYSKEWIQESRNINKDVKVVKTLDGIDISKFDTICIDYAELFDYDYLQDLVKTLMELDIRIIVASHMKRGDFHIQHNMFEKVMLENLTN